VVVSSAVNAGQSARLDGVPDGNYDLYYTLGQDWDAGLATFSRHCEFHRFTTPTSFSTRPVTGGSAYTVQSIVLTGQDDAPRATGPDPAAAPGGRPDTPGQDGRAMWCSYLQRERWYSRGLSPNSWQNDIDNCFADVNPVRFAT